MLESVFFFASVSSSLLAASRAFGSNGSVAERCQHLACTFGERRRRSRAYRSLPRRVPGTSCAARGGTRGSRCRSRWGHPRSRRRHPWWRARFTRPRVWQSHHSDQSFQVLKKADAVAGHAGRSGTFRSDIRVSVVYTTLSERVRTRRALTTPRGRDTLGRSRTSGESLTSRPRPARVVSGPPRAHATRPPTPFGRCWFPNEKAHSSYRTGRGVRVKKRTPASRAGRGHRSRAAGPTRAHVDAPPSAFLLPHALTSPPPSTRNRGCRKPHPLSSENLQFPFFSAE